MPIFERIQSRLQDIVLVIEKETGIKRGIISLDLSVYNNENYYAVVECSWFIGESLHAVHYYMHRPLKGVALENWWKDLENFMVEHVKKSVPKKIFSMNFRN